MALNLMMPGNPRNQPKDLQKWFGYDNTAGFYVQVQLASMRTLHEFGIITDADMALLTPEIEQKLGEITTTQNDDVERRITNHDIRALVHIIQGIMPEPLRRWVHVPMTSYDVIDTARAYQYSFAHQHVVRPKIIPVLSVLKGHAEVHRSTVQIGRTHGQHALPITFGFWIATIMSRLLYNMGQADTFNAGLVGKIAGAVGAYNAQTGLGIFERNGMRFEDRVLGRLGLKPAWISTQIVPPEPLGYYLYSMLMLSGAFGQFGRDGRNLMRTEIAELSEPFEKGQVGSSTMAHKRNPLNFENIEGTFFKNVGEYVKVLMTVISEHQRDLVGSTISRDFPAIVINAVSQMDTLMRPNKAGVPFLTRVKVNAEACKKNAQSSGDTILAEPLYLALQMNGYRGDAHKLINEEAMAFVSPVCNLYMAIEFLMEDNQELAEAWNRIPAEMKALFSNPENYVGRAAEQTDAICARVQDYIARN